MRIEAYFRQVRKAIEACEVIQTFNITYDKRGSYEGFIRGEIHFINGSVLHLREFIDVEVAVERLTYAYHYIDPAQQFVFRYDNTGHHRKLNLPTHPHHKHQGSEDNILASSAPDLSAVLDEIALLL